MHNKFKDHFCDPVTHEPLSLYTFENEGENIISGMFVNKLSGMSFAVYNGVAIFLPNSFPTDFLNVFNEKIVLLKSEIPNLQVRTNFAKSTWSFSLEWEAHKNLKMTTTWGMTLKSRYEQFLYETQSLNEKLEGKLILDAGCGNGLLTEYFANHGGLMSIGIDFSSSVFAAEKRRNSENCCFIQGDLMLPPFRNETFDIIVSNGVLHHTPDTESTFRRVANMVKQNGKFYLWLYSRKGNLLWRFNRRIFDFLRIIICRMPSWGKKITVKMIAFSLYYAYLLVGKKLDQDTLLIDIYDSVTPRWRYYHTPEEISRWFYESGFGPLAVTYWDSKYGFGSMAVKTRMSKTPGDNFIVG